MTRRRLVTFALGFAVVHVMACLPWYPGGTLLSTFGRLPPDGAIVLGLALLGVVSGWRRTALHASALLLTLSMLFGAVATIWPMRRDRAFELSDVHELPGLPHLLFGLAPDWWVALLVFAPVVLALHLSAYFSLARLAAAGGIRGAATWIALLQALVLIGAAGGARLWHGSSLGALARATARTIGQRIEAGQNGDRFAAPPGAESMAEAPHDLRGLGGADVHVLFLESYGRVALRHPEIGAHLRALWPVLERELLAAGFEARSGACRPSVSGGGSLLAHAQLFTGIHVPDTRTWERLQFCGLRPLPQLFLDAGYHTVEAMPAMDRHWVEGAKFFGFAEQVTQIELGYTGFEYHFGDMPDQFGLHHLLERVIAPAQKPVFSTYVSVTSHLPCTHIPPYVEDWNVTAATFAGKPAISYDTSWLNTGSSADTVPAFRDALAYSMRTAVGFTCRLQRPSLVIVLGDHQPPIRGDLVPADVSFDVPLHVFANRPELLQALAAFGLVPGLDVPSDLTAFDSADFGPLFLRAFSRP